MDGKTAIKVYITKDTNDKTLYVILPADLKGDGTILIEEQEFNFARYYKLNSATLASNVNTVKLYDNSGAEAGKYHFLYKDDTIYSILSSFAIVKNSTTATPEEVA